MGINEWDYLKRRRLRLLDEGLTRQIVFGLGVGTALTLSGVYHYFLVVGANDQVWIGITIAGIVSLMLTLILPAVWSPCVSLSQWFGQRVGRLIFTILLCPLYFLLVWPAGILMRGVRGSHPIYCWAEGNPPPARMEGWRDKTVTVLKGLGNSSGSFFLQPFFVIGFFLKHGHYAMLPLLVVLIVIGLLLFFLQSSVFAPLIYPLF